MKYGVNTAMKYFVHLDRSVKFQQNKEHWQNEMEEIKNFIVKGQKFPILEISDPVSFCF